MVEEAEHIESQNH